MKNLIVVILTFLLPSLASAENIGVAENNFSVSGKFSTINSKYADYEDYTWKVNLLSAMGTFALGQYGGATGFLKSGETSNSNSPTEETKSVYGGLLFLRNASIGRIAFGYDKSKSKRTRNDYIRLSNTSTYTDTMYSVLLDYYYKDFTVAIERFNIERKFPLSDYYGNDYEVNISSLSGVWHIHENLLLRLSTIGMDFKDSNSISLIYQPELFNRSTSFTFKYLNIDKDSDVETSLSLLSVNYYFGTRVSLKNRERKYSSYLYSNFWNEI